MQGLVEVKEQIRVCLPLGPTPGYNEVIDPACGELSW